MSQTEEAELIQREARGMVRSELEYWMHDVDHDPQDWPEGYGIMDAMEDVMRSPVLEGDRAGQRELHRLYRLLGWETQVQPGEEVCEMSGGRCRWLKPGAWHWTRNAEAR